MSGLLAEILVSVPASSIAGGTDEIQHAAHRRRLADHQICSGRSP
jgi:hypothetical protein